MGLALLRTPEPALPKSHISVETREEKIALAKEVQSLIALLLLKLRQAIGGSGILTNIPDGLNVMYDSSTSENHIFRVGAYMKVSLPEIFIQDKKDIDNEQVDFLIRDWIFDLNGQIITPQEWTENDLIDGSLISGVPVKVNKVLDLSNMDNKAKEKALEINNKRIFGLRESLRKMVVTLLPPRVNKPEIKKEDPVTQIKFPILTVSKRPINQNNRAKKSTSF